MIVVDTNILLYAWGPSGRRAEAIAGLMRFDPVWSAPRLWRSEFRNMLARGIRQDRLPLPEAEAMLSRAGGSLLGGERDVPDPIVLSLAASSGCTAYDCEFAGLAALLQTVLVTADQALLQAFPGWCRSLDEMAARR